MFPCLMIELLTAIEFLYAGKLPLHLLTHMASTSLITLKGFEALEIRDLNI